MTRADSRAATCRRGLTMLEVVAASALLGAVLVGAMSGISSLRTAQLDLADAAQAELLARELMSEILQQPYQDSDSPRFGLETGETTSPPTRRHFDDLDDYQQWNQDLDIAPQSADGEPLAVGEGWRRQVAVDRVWLGDLTRAVDPERGVRRITVSVQRDGRQLTVLVATTSAAWHAATE